MYKVDKITEVSNYIDENIYHSKVWDNADNKARVKAVNNSERILKRLLSEYLGTEVPVEYLAEQAVYLMRIDDTFLRAELGATSITLDGISVSIKDRDRTIAPAVLDSLGITPDAITGGLSRRKVGSYTTSIGDSYRGYVYRGRLRKC